MEYSEYIPSLWSLRAFLSSFVEGLIKRKGVLRAGVPEKLVVGKFCFKKGASIDKVPVAREDLLVGFRTKAFLWGFMAVFLSSVKPIGEEW